MLYTTFDNNSDIMLNNEQIQQLINECRTIGSMGTVNGTSAKISELIVDILVPPADFLGTNGNSAIFINAKTFNLLGALHSNWIVNQTIALKDTLLSQKKIDIIGTIIHETGHAFNVAAKIENSEANAYIFEIEVLLQLKQSKSPLLFGCTDADLAAYFQSRYSNYIKGINYSDYLADLLVKNKSLFTIEPAPILPTLFYQEQTMSAKPKNQFLFFALARPITEYGQEYGHSVWPLLSKL